MCVAKPLRGFTLFEVTIVSALLLLLGTIFVQVLIPSFRTTASTQRRVTMQQKALLVFRRLSRDLQDTTPAALSISTAPAALSGQPLKEFTSTGARVFETRLWVYYLAGDELRRADWQSPGPPSLSVTLQTSAPARLPQADLAKFSTASLDGAYPLADSVTAFALSHAGVGTAVAGPITVELTMQDEGNDPARVQMRRIFSPRLGE